MGQDHDKAARYLINDVSQRVGLSQKRIREYEKSGFIKPSRAPRTNNRLYEERDIARILRVKELIHQHGFTLTCLRYFFSSAPCWTIFNCKDKKACPAYGSFNTPCYMAVKETSGEFRDGCLKCPVYLNREVEQLTLLEKAPTGNESLD